jgi:Heterokaryon incompatibility protein (HET)
MCPYDYTLLPDRSIRLLNLNPSDKYHEPLSGTLVIIDIEDAPEFEAISYVWGEPSFSESIQIDGKYAVAITLSLASALRRFRRHDSARLLWADGICIDQNNNAEKAVQVPLMADIYKSAIRTLAWLGEGDEDLEQALEFLRVRTESANPANEEAEPGTDETTPNKGIQAAKESHVESVFRNTWFTRLWIAQEAILAQDLRLYYGNQFIPWTDLDRFIHSYPKLSINLNSTSLAGFQYAQNLSHARSDWTIQMRTRNVLTSLKIDDWQSVTTPEGYATSFLPRLLEAHAQATGSGAAWIRPQVNFNRGNAFMEIFWALQSRHCKDGRDRVYAALGFLHWDVPLKMRPDYEKSVRDVYVEFARAMIELNYLEILLYAGLWDRLSVSGDAGADARTDGDSCPSWVPELRLSKLKEGAMNAWDHPMLDEPIKTLELPTIRWCSASESESDASPSPYRMYIQGIIFDKITGGRQWTDNLNSVEGVIYTLRLYFIGFAELRREETKIQTFGKLLGVLSYPELGSAGRDDPEDMNHLQTLLFADEQDLLAFLSASQQLISEHELLPEAEKRFWGIMNIAQFLCKKLANRMFYTTEKGECGLAPAMADVGDALVRFMGQGVECVIRPVTNSEDFQLIGPCYYHGVAQFESGLRWIPLV